MLYDTNIDDSLIRDALKNIDLGEIKRSTYFWVGEHDLPMNRCLGKKVVANVTYTIDDKIRIRCNVVSGRKTRNKKREGVVSLSDNEHFQGRVKKIMDAYHREYDEAQANYQRRLDAWKEKYPNYDPSKKVIVKSGKFRGLSGIPRAALERPQPVMIPIPNEDSILQPDHGVLIKNYRDKELKTIKVTSIQVRYIHDDGIMSLNRVKDTNMTADELEGIMGQLCKKYDVGIISPNYSSFDGYSCDVGMFCNPPRKASMSCHFAQQVKVEEFNGDDLVQVVNNIYQATQDYINGVTSLKEAAFRKKQQEQRAIDGAFAL